MCCAPCAGQLELGSCCVNSRPTDQTTFPAPQRLPQLCGKNWLVCQQSQSWAVLGAGQLQMKGTDGLSPGAHVSEVTSIPPQATAECKGVYTWWGSPKVGAIQWLW